MLQLDFALPRFITPDKVADQDVARTLGMHQWIPGEDELVAHLRKRDIPKFMIEHTDQAMPLKASENHKFKYCRKSALNYVEQQIGKLQKEAPKAPEIFEHNMHLLTRLFNLSEVEKKIVAFHILLHEFPVLNRMLHTVQPKHRREYVYLISVALGASAERIEQALAPESRMMEQGLLDWRDHDGDYQAPIDFFDYKLAKRITWERCTENKIMRDIVSPLPKPTLEYKDYPNMRDVFLPVRAYLRKALKERQPGVNLFIYGKPGVGKSEFPRVLARELRAEIYEISSEDNDGDAVEPEKRLEAYNRACGLLCSRRSLLVFDEAEDTFRPQSIFRRGLASTRKGWINRKLEQNPVPVIWISNSTEGLEPAFARRFDFVFEMKSPSQRQRVKTYRGITGNRLSPVTLRSIAECEELTPAIVARASSVAQGVCDASASTTFEPLFTNIVEETLRAQGHPTGNLRKQESKLPSHYTVDFLNTDPDLASLADALKMHPACRMCLYGPPGTGKTTLGHWLSQELDLPLSLKKASDLISPYIGETEKNFAAAFHDAREKRSILMIDEVDSFLQDRSLAVRSWEVTEVNEFLTQMENFEGIFIASTNLMDGIDQAALRRFDLKYRFGYLNGSQLEQLLVASCRELKLGAPHAADRQAIAALTNATPGDFANCRRQARFRHFQNASGFVQAIVAECLIKADQGGRMLGFAG